MRIAFRRSPKSVVSRRFDRPIIWGLLYLSLIPAFAVIYVSKADSFYQVSATHEPSYPDIESRVVQAVALGASRGIDEQALVDNLNSSQLGGAYGLRATANSTDILATLELNTESKAGDVAVQVDIPEYSIPPPNYVVDNLVSVPYSIVSTTKLSVESGSGPSLQLFEQYTNRTPTPTLSLTLAELDSVQQLSNAAQGLVGGLPDQFSRMLYFSAVVATTLGFGDITPVTILSRSLVTLEAVLGVVFVGLFLNSLARRRSDAGMAQASLPSPSEHDGQSKS
jgi:hypothetical protein